MANGDRAKGFIMNKIIAALSDSYLGTQDKKYYFNSKENGETKVVCLAATCPKAVPEFAATNNSVPTGDFDWGEPSAASKPVTPEPQTEITEQEIQNLKTMLENLGL